MNSPLLVGFVASFTLIAAIVRRGGEMAATRRRAGAEPVGD